MNENEKLICNLMSFINIKIQTLDQLENKEIDRDILKSKTIIKNFHEYIPKLKTIYNSDMFSCLHKNSITKQKQPAVCMLRQLLKANNYKMEPKIYSLGYNKTNGKKIVRRTYIIKKIIT